MMRRSLQAFLCLAIAAWPAARGFGQEFRYYTAVYDLSGAQNPGDEGSPVASTLTLFHAGKVYDYIPSGGQVAIYEPVHQRFTLLNPAHRLACRVHVDEITHKLRLAEGLVRKRIRELAGESEPQGRHLREVLAFQLDPEFAESYDEQADHLSLTSPHFSYGVKCAGPESQSAIDPGSVEAYLQFADWISRLNYVVHPRVLLPGPRLALNAALRRRGMLPVEVELLADIGPKVHLRAEHKIHWKLTGADRDLIEGWESMLRGKKAAWVPFQRFQELMQDTRTASRR